MYRVWMIAASCALVPALAAADDAGRAVVEKAIKAPCAGLRADQD